MTKLPFYIKIIFYKESSMPHVRPQLRICSRTRVTCGLGPGSGPEWTARPVNPTRPGRENRVLSRRAGAGRGHSHMPPGGWTDGATEALSYVCWFLPFFPTRAYMSSKLNLVITSSKLWIADWKRCATVAGFNVYSDILALAPLRGLAYSFSELWIQVMQVSCFRCGT